ncbi:MAG: HAMP domain-containing protein [Sedimentisphaerales bacterium]|nr:HAMP domain-containing protein [Sedimentisphaerales bacterium]
MSQRRLLWQIYPAYLLIVVVALVVIAVYLSQLLPEFYDNQVAADLQARARLIEKQVLPKLEESDFKDIDRLTKELGQCSSTRITIILADGKVIAESDKEEPLENHSDRPEFKDAFEKGIGRSLRFSDTLGEKMMYLAVPIEEQGKVLAVVRTAIPVTAIHNELNKIYDKIFLSVVIVAVIAALISLVISRRISRPIEQMKDTAQRFASGELNLRVPVPKQIELAELAGSLNEMARQLQKRFETITRQRNESEAILSSMVEGVLAVDSDGRIVSVNHAAANFLGIEKDKAQGRSVEEAIRNPDLQKYLHDVLSEAETGETDIVLSGPVERIIRLDGAGLADSRGARSGAVIVLSDITRIRRLENLRRDFVANVSHELRTPITSIKGFVETLQEGAITEPKEAERFLQIIARHSDRLNAIVEDLLTLSSLEETGGQRKITFEKKHLKPVLSSVVELSSIKARDKNIKVDLDCGENIQAKINPALLEQAVLNLVDNAVKYSEPKSTIQIQVRQKNGMVAVSVHDNGCGIAKKYQERIFERFYVVDKSRSRKLGGTGLGLAIVKHIAEVHGGNVTVQSTLGAGSTFTVNLPLD